jgi:hypothetical protein
METDHQTNPAAVFPQILIGAVSHLKNRLQRQYEHAYPGFGDIIRIVLDKEEARAWDLSPFPHLFLPDLVEAHIAQLGLQPARLEYHDELPQPEFSQIESHHVFPALCGS